MKILFDLDNTLIDEEFAKVSAIQFLYNKFRKLTNLDEQTFLSRYRYSIPKYYKMYTDGRLTYDEQRKQGIFYTFDNFRISDEAIISIIDSFHESYQNCWRLYDQTEEVLNHFRSNGIGLITNGSSKQQNRKIDKLNLRKYFNFVLISGEEGFAKPDERIFLKACDIMDCEPSECTFIGDSWESDVLGSNNCGMTSVWFNRCGKELPDKIDRLHMITDLNDLKKIIREN